MGYGALGDNVGDVTYSTNVNIGYSVALVDTFPATDSQFDIGGATSITITAVKNFITSSQQIMGVT